MAQPNTAAKGTAMTKRTPISDSIRRYFRGYRGAQWSGRVMTVRIAHPTYALVLTARARRPPTRPVPRQGQAGVPRWYEIRAAQRAREAALTDDQRRIRDLESELTHVKAMLHTRGGRRA